MSCSSPFAYKVSATTDIISESTFVLSGSYTLASYTIPGVSICEPTMNCHWGGPWGCTLECSWGWCCCWSTPSIPIWPTIDFGASMKTPITVATKTSVSFTSTSPPTPVATAELQFGTTTITLDVGVDGETVPITLKLPSFDVNANNNGTYSADIPIGDISTTMESAPGTTFTLSIDAEMLMCLDPKPPQGWVNIKLSCNLSCDIEGIVYKESFSIDCPIVSVED